MQLRSCYWNSLNMFVERLGPSSLLLYCPVRYCTVLYYAVLYCPVRVREEHGFRAWLDSLGSVDWVVVGSSYHTLYLPALCKQ